MSREEKISRLKDILSEINENDNAVCYLTSEDNELIESAIEALEQESQTFEWCTGCREYDQEKHCCHRWSKVIRNAVEEMKQPKVGHWISYWDEEARCYVYKCPECGNKQPFDTKHCWECGTRLDVPDINDGKLSEIPTGSESEKKHMKKDRLGKTISDIAYILDNLCLLRQIYKTGDCNNCKNRDCGYMPKPGQLVRYNCPFYKAESEE